jgi:hypothetical protein
MPVKLLAILALLCAAQLNGVQVTGELIYDPSTGGLATFILNGPNFSLTGVAGDLERGNPCFQSCSPGDIGVFNTAIFWDTSRLDSATVDGITYSDVFFGSAGTHYQSQFFFRSPSFTVTESLVYTAPLSFDANLIVFRGSEWSCIICDPPTDSIDPSQPSRPIRVIGHGFVTMTLRENTEPVLPRFVLDRIVYQLVPEPSTFFLVSVPLAAVLLVRRLLRAYFGAVSTATE